MKLFVVPEASARCTVTMLVLGSEAPALSAAIAGSFHFVTVPMKIFATVDGLSFSESRPLTLYDTVIGATTVGK